jgi:hypothetical protein
MIKPPNKVETFGILLILAVIFVVSFFNFKVALRRSRDVQRKNDLSTLQNGLNNYLHDFGVFPMSSDNGEIVACKGEETVWDEKYKVWLNLVPCVWGKDALADFSDPTYPAYIPLLPRDPQYSQGGNYLYISNGNRYQIFIYLEGEADEAEYDPIIVARNLSCGNRICNYGEAYSQTPLDKTLQEYENELEAKLKK